MPAFDSTFPKITTNELSSDPKDGKKRKAFEEDGILANVLGDINIELHTKL